ncbi:cellulose synthase complex periplasmic endoglucanase BcsZ [Chitinimonas sp.]|uniref:cellulose synthase complex periplasmic endoglucanase BcsZ n=1 Tax=Chitinimonas sp. TaxID=1934313 RepID=UPI0035B162EB
MRHRLALLAAAFGLGLSQPAAAGCEAWPAWQQFRDTLLRDEGRIVDPSDTRLITTSEGQSYALFFALVANDRRSFDQLLAWTDRQLAAGQLGNQLPAWLWGRQADGSWGVLDSNSASDSDLWIAYTLLEAARLWRQPRYQALGTLLARQIVRQEVAELPGLGPTLLPAPHGFNPAPGRWRLNPSYLPLPLLRRLAQQQPGSAWPAILQSSLRVITESAPHGYSPDWVQYQAGTGWVADKESQASGSYNAIRSYLWLGLSHPEDPARAGLLRALQAMASETTRRGAPPEVVDTAQGLPKAGDGPAGFSASLMVMLDALNQPQAAEAQRQRWQAKPPAADAYYNQSLSLFAFGFREKRYAFAPDGALVPAWQRCATPASR